MNSFPVIICVIVFIASGCISKIVLMDSNPKILLWVLNCEDIMGEWIEADSSRVKVDGFHNVSRFTISDKLYLIDSKNDTIDILTVTCDSSHVVYLENVTLGKPKSREIRMGMFDIAWGPYYSINSQGILELTDPKKYFPHDTNKPDITVYYYRLDRNKD